MPTGRGHTNLGKFREIQPKMGDSVDVIKVMQWLDTIGPLLIPQATGPVIADDRCRVRMYAGSIREL
jgi:hypothetical protein